MKKKLKLNELRVKSFVTAESAQVKGGAPDHSVRSKDFVCPETEYTCPKGPVIPWSGFDDFCKSSKLIFC